MYANTRTGDASRDSYSVWRKRRTEKGQNYGLKASAIDVGQQIVARIQVSSSGASRFVAHEFRGRVVSKREDRSYTVIELKAPPAPEEDRAEGTSLELWLTPKGDIVTRPQPGQPAQPAAPSHGVTEHQPVIPPKPARVCGYVLQGHAPQMSGRMLAFQPA